MHDEGADVVLQTEESGILIGYHGEILEALQLVLSLMVSRKLDRFVRISVEVGDYKKNRSEYLEKLAMQTKERVLEENRPHTLSSLKSWERRIVHMILQQDDQVISESMGEGRDRVLVVKPRE
jgi:spoIIIJ-associated protein